MDDDEEDELLASCLFTAPLFTRSTIATMRALLLLLPLLALASATVSEPSPSCTAYTQALELMHSLERTARAEAGNIASGKGSRVRKGDVWAMVWRGQGGSQTVSCAVLSSGGMGGENQFIRSEHELEESQNQSVAAKTAEHGNRRQR